MSDSDYAKLPYEPALDGIRAIAILLVFLYHWGLLVGGWIGVDIFFALSGYLITSLLVMEYEKIGSIRLARFFAHRARRLLPAAVVMICAALVLSIVLHDSRRETALDSAAALTYLLDFRYAFFFPLSRTGLAHLWSLSVEEQFYLVWPLTLIASLSVFGRRGTLICALVAIGVVIFWRAFLLVDGSHSPYYRIYFAFDTRMDELLIGSALALWGYRPGQAISKKLVWCWPPLTVMLAVILFKVDAVTKWEAVSIYPFLGSGAAFLIVLATSATPSIVKRILTIAPLVALGRISYGFYLWHYLIMIELMKHGFQGSIAILATFGLTLAASIASYQIVERPALRLIRTRPRETLAIDTN
jgi:peptidoglycan/LPS O-acetylase OafA/YrhL